MSRPPQTPRPVAFVLSSGSSMAASQVGMLRSLVEHGIRPDMVIGCSGGAFNGATFAEDPSLARLTRMAHVWTTTSARDILRRPWMSPAVALMGRGQAVHPTDGLRELFGRMVESEKFEQLAVPFHCVATDVEAASEHWFSEGALADAVVASAATPVMFPPVEIDGRSFIDGGVVNDVPVRRAVELGAGTVYVMEVGRLSRSWEEPSRPVRMAVEAYWVARRHRYRRELEEVPDDVAVHVLPHQSPRDLKFHDITRSTELIDGAYHATNEYLASTAAGTDGAGATAGAAGQRTGTDAK